MEHNDNKELLDSLREQINSYPAILYMKGTPQFPQCGFSSRVVAILKSISVPFAFINILDEPAIRAYLPKVSDWPTFPQLFINGELVGGCDIIEELQEENELAQMFEGLEWPNE